MKLFGLFKKQKEAAVDNRKAPEILRDVLSLIPDVHASNRHYQQSEEFLAHSEWGLALEMLVELATSSDHFFSEHFWTELSIAAERMQMHEMAKQCRSEGQRMKSRLGVNAPLRGWTVVHSAPLRFETYISKRLQEEYRDERWKKDRVHELLQRDGVHLKMSGRGGTIYFIERGKLAEIDVELGKELILYFDATKKWLLPRETELSIAERERIKAAIQDQLGRKKTLDWGENVAT
jgi:hypothetical protein